MPRLCGNVRTIEITGTNIEVKATIEENLENNRRTKHIIVQLYRNTALDILICVYGKFIFKTREINCLFLL